MSGEPAWRHTRARCAVVPLPLNLASLPKSARRQHIRREQRVSARGHHVSYRRSQTTDQLLCAFQELEFLHVARRSGSDMSRGASSGSWAAVLQQCGSSVAFIASTTLDGTTPMAAQLCLYRDSRCYSVRPARHPGLSGLSPGHILLRRLAADAASNGFTALDLGRTVDSPAQIGYKDQYGPRWNFNLTFVLNGSVEQQ
ncbi:GNAT family N-acetyltransferase [Streptomyces sp. NPDC015125]|uniref:GNAT family N-acetyltransferase n=1 Tax=Streptomyces sp. NPDC015125 TaxID=3364938 RepID=UPI0037020917